jgi:hypothetical protein
MCQTSKLDTSARGLGRGVFGAKKLSSIHVIFLNLNNFDKI